MQGELSALNLWLKVNKLSLNVAKTEFMIVSSRQKLDAVADNHCINLNIEGKIIKRVNHAKSLGLYVQGPRRGRGRGAPTAPLPHFFWKF